VQTEVEPSEVGPLRAAARESPDAVQLAERALRVAIGLAALAVGSVADAIASTLRRGEQAAESADDQPTPIPLLPMLAGAGLAIGFEVARTSVRVVSIAGRSFGPWMSFVTWPRLVRGAMERARDEAARLDELWRAERSEDERFGSAFIGAIVPPAVDAVLDRLDLTELAVSRIDLNRVVEAIDPDRIVGRIDIDGIVDRVNLDAVAARLDVEAVVRRIDLVAIAREVIDQIDLPRIVRESTGTMANETVEGIRVQGMSADRAVSRFVDRILGRDGFRDDPEG
jgi:hypothetical protein